MSFIPSQATSPSHCVRAIRRSLHAHPSV